MSYLLCLVFEYRRFKRDAIVRIYADDLLVDELNLSEDIYLKVKNKMDAPSISDTHGPENISRLLYLPERCFTFQLNEKHLKRSIRLEVINDNNNYTNGFMTSFSYIKFHHVLLIPDCLLDIKNWKHINRKAITSTPPISTKYYPMRGLQHCVYKLTSNTDNDDKEFQFKKRGDSFTIELGLFKKHGLTHLCKPEIGKLHINTDVPKILHWFNLLNTHR